MPDWIRHVSEHLDLPDVSSTSRERFIREFADQLEEFYVEALANGHPENEAQKLTEQHAGDWKLLSSELASMAPPDPQHVGSEQLATAGEGRKLRMLLTDTIKDLRHGLRTLRRRPLLLGTVTIVLALGISVNTTLFSLVETVLLRPIPFHDPERLVVVWETLPGGQWNVVSPSNFLDWREQNSSFVEICAMVPSQPSLSGDGRPERVLGERVTADFFELLGVQAALGRSFSSEDDEPGADKIVVLSDPFWKRRFGADPEIVGKEIRLDGEVVTVVGVMPTGFRFRSNRTELWTPLVLDPATAVRDLNYLRVVARLGDGVTLAQARSEMETVAAKIADTYPEIRDGWSTAVVPLRDWLVNSEFATSLVLLFFAAAFLLLLACINVASLLLAYASSRQRELAVRISLGASRGRIMRQLLTEGTLIATLGGVVGLALTIWFLSALSALPQSALLPAGVWPEINGRILLFILALCGMTTVLFGLAPAWRAARISPIESLRGRTPGGGSRSHRSLRALATAEVALAVALAVASGLMVRSLLALQGVDSGVQTRRVLTAKLNLPEARYSDTTSMTSFYREALRRIEALPGVTSAGISTELPMCGSMIALPFEVVGKPVVPISRRPDADIQIISPGYFQTLGIPVIQGRGFTDSDNESASRVAIVNETFIRQHLIDEDPLRSSLRIPTQTPGEGELGPVVDLTIVGVVGDVKIWGLGSGPASQIYIPYPQGPWPSTALAVQAERDETRLARPLQEAILDIDGELPLTELLTMDEILSSSTSQPRFRSLVMSLFAASALALAALGVYGVVAYSVAERTREIGIHMAIGATPSAVMGTVLRQALSTTLYGIVLGVLAAYGLAKLMGSLLFGVGPMDPLTFGSVALILLLVTALAALLPARRASKIDPVIALRGDQ